MKLARPWARVDTWGAAVPAPAGGATEPAEPPAAVPAPAGGATEPAEPPAAAAGGSADPDAGRGRSGRRRAAGWDTLAALAEQLYGAQLVAERELNAALAAAERLQRARGAVLGTTTGVRTWRTRLAEALQPHPGTRRVEPTRPTGPTSADAPTGPSAGDRPGEASSHEGAAAAADVLDELAPPAVRARLLKWCAAQPEAARAALRALWREGAPGGTAGRLDAFLQALPQGVARGAGSRLTLAAVLLAAVDPTRYPPYDGAGLAQAYALARAPRPPRGASPAAAYEHGLRFLDTMLAECAARGLALRHRLNAWAVLRALARVGADGPLPADLSEEQCQAIRRVLAGIGGRPTPPATATAASAIADRRATYDPGSAARLHGLANLADLADALLLDEASLRRTVRLLADKGQCIFYGPPGTGKTFVARRLAAYLAGDESRVEVVQFHPSYAYEDFVEGYRPGQAAGGRAQFHLVDGPLKRIAREAQQQPALTHVLLIDELNRGNVGKLFGELYYLLEYRGAAIRLQYSAQPFALPPNLWIIATMNTADRSIALVDLALRRRFYFVPFFPDQPPVQGLLRRWLQRHHPQLAWVAAVVDRANARLKDRELAIGPSFFMRPDLDEEWVALIWEHGVLPYLAEQFPGDDDALRELALDRLR